MTLSVPFPSSHNIMTTTSSEAGDDDFVSSRHCSSKDSFQFQTPAQTVTPPTESADSSLPLNASVTGRLIANVGRNNRKSNQSVFNGARSKVSATTPQSPIPSPLPEISFVINQSVAASSPAKRKLDDLMELDDTYGTKKSKFDPDAFERRLDAEEELVPLQRNYATEDDDLKHIEAIISRSGSPQSNRTSVCNSPNIFNEPFVSVSSAASLSNCLEQVVTSEETCPFEFTSWTEIRSQNNEAFTKSECSILALQWKVDRDHDLYILSQQTPDNLSHHQELQTGYRQLLVRWMMDYTFENSMHRKTFHLSVSFLNLYLGKSEDPVTMDHFQTLGAAMVFVASKIEEAYPASLMDLIQFAAATAAPEHHERIMKNVKSIVLRFERLLYVELDNSIDILTGIDYLHRFFQNFYFVDESEEFNDAGELTEPRRGPLYDRFLCIIARLDASLLFDYIFLKYSNSKIAACFLKIEFEHEWSGEVFFAITGMPMNSFAEELDEACRLLGPAENNAEHIAWYESRQCDPLYYQTAIVNTDDEDPQNEIESTGYEVEAE